MYHVILDLRTRIFRHLVKNRDYLQGSTDIQSYDTRPAVFMILQLNNCHININNI